MIKALIFAGIAIFGGLLLYAASAHASTAFLPITCGDKERLLEATVKRYDETLALTMRANQTEVSLYINDTTKTYSLFIDTPSGFCMMSSGVDVKTIIKGDDT